MAKSVGKKREDVIIKKYKDMLTDDSYKRVWKKQQDLGVLLMTGRPGSTLSSKGSPSLLARVTSTTEEQLLPPVRMIVPSWLSLRAKRILLQ